MTDEELAALIQETSGQIDRLSQPGKPLTKKEQQRKWVFQSRRKALERIKVAKEKGDQPEEIRAGTDYAVLTEYGERHPLLLYFMQLRTRSWHGF